MYKGEEEANRRGMVEEVHRDHIRSSRLLDNMKGKNITAVQAVIRDIFGDFDDDASMEKEDCGQTNKKRGSPKFKENYANESWVGNTIPDEDETYESKEEFAKRNLKGKGVAPADVFKIPSRSPPINPNKMATVKLPNFIGIDPKPFDPTTYVEEDTDASGTKRRVPPANVIRFREVKKNDGTTSFESNARFVEWSDGSMKLVIGNEAFDVSEKNTQETQSHLFRRHGKEIYQSQGRISREMKFTPSSVSSTNSHRSLTSLVNSRHNEVNKIQLCTSDVDPESMIKQEKKAEIRATKASQQLNEKKQKVINLEDSVDKDVNYDNPSNALPVHLFGVDLKAEAAVGKRLMNARMSQKDTRRSSPSSKRF